MNLKEPKRLVYAYDELQNLSNSAMPSVIEIFGVNEDGTPRVSLETTTYDRGARRDIILEKCYRNSRPVLTSAHAVGFGVYREPAGPGKSGLVQIFDDPELWCDIGYIVKDGHLALGADIVLERTADTSPSFLETHSPLDDLIQFVVFDSADAQNEWIAAQIGANLTDDELRHDDIVVINPDPFTTRSNLGPIRRKLLERGIMSHLAGVDTGADVFFRPDSQSVTFSGIFRAKGNEAGMVYVVNANECYNTELNLARRRNMLFIAITRGKAWVRVTGIGPSMRRLANEYEALKAAEFELRFTYPTDRERAQLKVVHRDATSEEEDAVRRQREFFDGFVQNLRSRKVLLEDLDEDQVAALREILNEHGG